MTTLNFPAIDCTFGTPVNIKPRTIDNEYGNGYRQSVGDGFNTMPETWSVSWDNVTWNDAQAVNTFLKNCGGTLAFNWVPPDCGLNQLLYTQQIDLWTLNAATITADAVDGPLGTILDADKLCETTATAEHYAKQAIPGALTIGNKWYVSAYAKQAERSKLFITMTGEGYSVFDLSAGTITQAGGNTCLIQNMGGGWFWCAARITKTNTSSDVFIGNWTTVSSYLGVLGSGLYLWGAQADLSDTLRAYKKNTTALNNNQFVCKNWSVEKMSAATGTVRAEFKQVFDL